MFENIDLFKGNSQSKKNSNIIKPTRPQTSTQSKNSLLHSMSNSIITTQKSKNSLTSHNTIQGLKALISNRGINDDSNMNYKNNIKITEVDTKIRDKSFHLNPPSKLHNKITLDNKIVIHSSIKNPKLVYKKDNNAFKVKYYILIK